jgi:hypothetical protein
MTDERKNEIVFNTAGKNKQDRRWRSIEIIEYQGSEFLSRENILLKLNCPKLP